MTDCILRIYSGSGAAWAETLDYEITGVLDYVVTDDSGYAVDTGWFKIEDIDHVYEAGIDPDMDTDVQVWRAYNQGDGKLLGSGSVVKIVGHGSFIELSGAGMNSLFKRRVVRDYSLTGDGSLKYTDVLLHATYGLLQGSSSGLLTAAEYKAFDISTHIVASSNLIPTGYELKYDNLSLYDVVVDVCNKCLGANDRNYDCYLFEMDADAPADKPTLFTADTKYKMCLYLKEKKSTASAKTLDGGDVDVGSVKWTNQKGGESYYNKVIVRGAFTETNICPNNKDWWTEFSGDPEADGIWGDVNGDVASSGTSTVGSYSVEFTVDGSTDLGVANLDLTDATSTNTTYTVDGMSSTNGYKIDLSKEQYLRFWIRCNAALVAELSGAKEYLAVMIWTENMSSTAEATGQHLFGSTNLEVGNGEQSPMFGVPLADQWYQVDLRLKDYISETDDYIETIGFWVGFEDSDSDGDEVVLVDGLHFYERDYQVEGSATKAGVTSNFRELLVELPELQNDDLCEKIAGDALKEQDSMQDGGMIPIIGPFRDVDLRAGNTIEISVDTLGLDVRVGASGSTSFEIEKIVYSVFEQVLHVGRNFSPGEMASAIKARAYRSFNRLRGR